jgi:hypothetical protein
MSFGGYVRSECGLTPPAIGSTFADDGSRLNHARPGEMGIRCGVGISRQIRDCPRNCKRRATPDATGPLRAGKAGQAQTRESGDLPSKSATTGRGAPEGDFDGR